MKPLLNTAKIFILATVGTLSPAVADKDDFRLSWPVDCAPGQTCWVARYVDRIPGRGRGDYRCGPKSQNKHKATDIMVSDMGILDAGVDILAAADGVVLRRRDGVVDGTGYRQGENCGNAYIIRHADGYASQYCHLKNGSLLKAVGDRVKAGEPIARMGLSGQTEFPHLHLVIRKGPEQTIIDPFDGGGFEQACTGGKTDSLWAETIAYDELTLLPISFHASPPQKQDRWRPPAQNLPPSSKALILRGRMFFAEAGDTWTFTIRQPDGSVFARKSIPVKKSIQFLPQWFGKKAPPGGFERGRWTGEITVKRGDKEVSQTAGVLIL